MKAGKATWFFIFFLLQSVTVSANPGKFDPSFGINGVVRDMFIPLGASGRSIAVQPDGQIIIAGATGSSPLDPHTNAILFRYNSDGTLDPSFGRTLLPDSALDASSYAFQAVRVQSDGKIVAIGTTQVVEGGGSRRFFIMIRRNSDGTPDLTFGSDGYIETHIGTGTFPDDYPIDLDFQADGKIVVVGQSDFRMAVVRYNEDGSMDKSFGSEGVIINPLFTGSGAVRIQNDQKIVIASGNRAAEAVILRLTPDGMLDPDFGDGGVVYDPRVSGAAVLEIRPNGRIIAGGKSSDLFGFSLLQLLTNGEPDASFGSDGLAYVSYANLGSRSIALQADGKVVAAIEWNIVRFRVDGSLDTQFGYGGSVRAFNGIGTVHDVALQSDGKIVTTGDVVGLNLPDLLIGRNLAFDTLFDYDADGRSDVSVFRPSENAWYMQRSSAGFSGQNFGLSGDRITPADYDGDGITDVAVYRPSTGIWYVFKSLDGTVDYRIFGIGEDLPTPADYDGDGKADISVFRPSTGTWYRQNSSDGSFFGMQFGLSDDKPAVGDFDGDGKADLAIFRPSLGDWYQLNSSNGLVSGARFGFGSDVIVPMDYDGDGKTDLAVFRPSTGIWYITNSSSGTVSYNMFGLSDDTPAPGDFDGDGKADISVFRPSDGTWYRQNSSDGSFFAYQFGTNGDTPTQTAFMY